MVYTVLDRKGFAIGTFRSWNGIVISATGALPKLEHLTVEDALARLRDFPLWHWTVAQDTVR